MTVECDVTIVGGGWSGLVSCKHMVENGLTPVVLEARDSVGGVWRYSPSPEITTVMRHTRTTSSRGVTEISDFPMPDDYPRFPSHEQIIRYLDRYVESFDLGPHIRCGTRVLEARKRGDRWHVATDDGEVYRSRFLVVCAGLHNEPNLDAADEVFADYSGEIIHSGTYKHPTASQEGKRILVFGGGETASDIADELSRVAADVHLAIPGGAWFLRRTFSSSDQSDVVDAWSSPLRAVISPTHRGSLFPLAVATLVFGEQGHGQPEWRSPAPYYGQFFNKSDDVLDAVKQGRVQPRSKVTGCEGRHITFADGATVEIDQVILCTGYRRRFGFLPGYETPTYRHHLFVFNNDDPSLAFIGFARPVVTSLPLMAELQARLVARVFSGRTRLPDRAAREAEIERDHQTVRKRYCKTSGRIDGLVDPQWYLSRVGRAAGVFPHFRRLFFRHPLLWLKLIRLPTHGSVFMVNEALEDESRLRWIVGLANRYRPRPWHGRFYADTCGGWLVIGVFEELARLWLRVTGQAHKYY